MITSNCFWVKNSGVEKTGLGQKILTCFFVYARKALNGWLIRDSDADMA